MDFSRCLRTAARASLELGQRSTFTVACNGRQVCSRQTGSWTSAHLPRLCPLKWALPISAMPTHFQLTASTSTATARSGMLLRYPTWSLEGRGPPQTELRVRCGAVTRAQWHRRYQAKRASTGCFQAKVHGHVVSSRAFCLESASMIYSSLA